MHKYTKCVQTEKYAKIKCTIGALRMVQKLTVERWILVVAVYGAATGCYISGEEGLAVKRVCRGSVKQTLRRAQGFEAKNKPGFHRLV